MNHSNDHHSIPFGGSVYRLISCLLLAALPFIAVTAGPVRYVTDNLSIPMRTGTTLQHKILKMLPSGVAVEVLEANNDNTRVKAQGAEGWVLTRFLENIPPARIRLDQAEQKVATLELENTRLKTEIKGVGEHRSQTESNYQKLQEDNQHLRANLNTLRQTAANVIDIAKQNDELKKRLIELERIRQALQQQNAVLQDRTARDWFMIGAAVAIAAMVVSLLTPKMIRWRRRSQWDTL
ncbi:SH3 domain protein [Gammaproteobacteria bacterium]